MERYSASQVAIAALAVLAVGWLSYALVTVPQLALFVGVLVAPVTLLLGTIRVVNGLVARTGPTPDWSSPTGSAAADVERFAD